MVIFMKKILVVEDEQSIRDLLTLNLKLADYDVVATDSAESAVEIYNKSKQKFDVALFDIMLPGINGLTLCETIRRKDNKIGILMLSSKAQEQDKIAGLSIGADDYITKPFSTAELIARIDAVYRRCSAANVSPNISLKEVISGDFVLDLASRIVTKKGEQLELTQVEFQIMEMFMENPGIALDRDRILQTVWGKNYFGDVKIVDVNIRRLRMKIEDNPSEPTNILTIWGYGYRWNT